MENQFLLYPYNCVVFDYIINKRSFYRINDIPELIPSWEQNIEKKYLRYFRKLIKKIFKEVTKIGLLEKYLSKVTLKILIEEEIVFVFIMEYLEPLITKFKEFTGILEIKNKCFKKTKIEFVY